MFKFWLGVTSGVGIEKPVATTTSAPSSAAFTVIGAWGVPFANNINLVGQSYTPSSIRIVVPAVALTKALLIFLGDSFVPSLEDLPVVLT